MHPSSSPAMFCPSMRARIRLMREVDQALARAYGHSGSRGALEHEPERSATGALAQQAPHRPGGNAGPHFAVAAQTAEPRGAAVSLRWPATVRTLEREHGERFERLADFLVEAREKQHMKV